MMRSVIRLYGVFFLLDLALMVIALIDCLSTDEYAVRNLPKVVWVFLILLFSPIGGIAWFVAGRPETHRGVGSSGRADAQWRSGRGFPEYERPRRPLGPDDDPAFFGPRGGAAPGEGAGTTPRGDRTSDEEMFARWEADLRRREEDLRRREKETDE